MADEKSNPNAFWQGYASILTLCPMYRPRRQRFIFRGVDLSTLSAAEALGQDWRNVGSSMASALQQMGEPENERREIEQPTR